MFGIRVFSIYSAILPSKEEMHIGLDGVMNRETDTYSLPETFAGREAALPGLPRAAHSAQRQGSIARPGVVPSVQAAQGSTAKRAPAWRRRMFCHLFPFSDLLLTTVEV